jgi:hypothetical protein
VYEVRPKRAKRARSSRSRKSAFFTVKDWIHLAITVAVRVVVVALWP